MVVAVYSITIFLSAMLLFLVQPMFAKMMLPLLGGSPYVWNTAIVFYQAVLLLGYTYAHFATKWLGTKRHAIVHVFLLALPFLFLPISMASAVPPTDTSPVPWLLLTMAASVGVPFFIVSTSGPLLQRWFAATGHERAPDPYFLYAASNFGSMIGLLAYPAWVEPNLTLAAQRNLWTFGYIAFAVLIVACAIVIWRSAETPHKATGDEPIEERHAPPTALRRFRWVYLAAIPASLMIGTTTYLSTDIVSMPLLWIIPLGVYLLTFMFTFAQVPPIPHKVAVGLLPPFLVITLAAFVVPITDPPLFTGSLAIITLFLAGLVFHGELAADRPSLEYLTEFFIWVSLGGVIGGLFASIIAPMVFIRVVEYPITLILAAFLMPRQAGKRRQALDMAVPILATLILYGIYLYKNSLPPVDSLYGIRLFAIAWPLPILIALMGWREPFRLGAALVGLAIVGVMNDSPNRDVIYRDRSFFGSLAIEQDKEGRLRELRHGTTNHGAEVFVGWLQREPLTYYTRSGPIGRVFWERGLPPNAKVAVIGLGVGSLAAYSMPGQVWTFYEIDPAVARVAQNSEMFTFLSDAKGKIDIVLGDGRLSMARSTDKYDLIVIDAYNSDSIPVHLLTVEAVQMYLDHLTPKGIMALHLSNRNMKLEPVVAAIAKKLELANGIFYDMDVPAQDGWWKQRSAWALLAPSLSNFGRQLAEDKSWRPLVGESDVLAWTDDYSAPFQVFFKSFAPRN